MKKTIISVTCVLLCLIMALSGCTFSDNNSQNLSSENLSSKKLSQKLSDGSWLNASWESELMVNDYTDGLGFVFKPIDDESGIAVSLDYQEFPYVINDDIIQMFLYNTDEQKYDHMFNAYFTVIEEGSESAECEALVLSATYEGRIYVDEWDLVGIPDIYLYHIEDTDKTSWLNKLYFDCWSTADTEDKDFYTNGFTFERRHSDLKLSVLNSEEAYLFEFYHEYFEFELDECNARMHRYDVADEKWYFSYLDYGLSEDVDWLKITYEYDSKYSGHYTEGDYVYDENLDALVKKDGSGVILYRVTRFADTDKVQLLSAERAKLLQEAVSQAVADYADWKKAYKEYLETFLEYDSYSNATFSVGYVDGDDIPELFVSLGEDYTDKVEILILNNGIIRKLDELGNYGTVSYIEHEGRIILDDSHQGISTCEVYKMYNGYIDIEWSGLACTANQIDGIGSATYYSGEEEVSESEYEKLLNQYRPEDKLKTSRLENGERGYALTAENLKMTFEN